ncbi:MAG: NADPH:quinone oxidoreductase family protein [Proteobacteria bacterium]|nr:NADPH:quinone oxidoreductase family protein [Pseudomonadota bacterium]
MQGLVCREYGLPPRLAFEDLPEPTPSADEVVVEVDACSISFPDVLIVQNRYQTKFPTPFVPGGELSGTVRAVGSNVVAFKRGDRVAGFGLTGAFAEQATLPASRLGLLPRSISAVTAASFPRNYTTVFHALKDRGRLQTGETLLVLGAAGGIGLAAIDLGRTLGARVIACASTAERLELCRQQGATDLINYVEGDLRAELTALTDGRGVDVIVDTVGGPLAERAMRNMAWNGRYLVIGFASGEVPKIALNIPLLKGCSIAGVLIGEFARHEPDEFRHNMDQLFAWLGDGKLNPYVARVMPLARATEALVAMSARQTVGKTVLVARDDVQ